MPNAACQDGKCDDAQCCGEPLDACSETACNGHGSTTDYNAADGCECDCIQWFSGNDCTIAPVKFVGSLTCAVSADQVEHLKSSKDAQLAIRKAIASSLAGSVTEEHIRITHIRLLERRLTASRYLAEASVVIDFEVVLPADVMSNFDSEAALIAPDDLEVGDIAIRIQELSVLEPVVPTFQELPSLILNWGSSTTRASSEFGALSGARQAAPFISLLVIIFAQVTCSL
jgi:hypothetical protein